MACDPLTGRKLSLDSVGRECLAHEGSQQHSGRKQQSTHASLTRRGSGRGFSTLEVVISLAMFLLLAAGLAASALSIASALQQSERQLAVAKALDQRLNVLATKPFDSLLAESYVAPDPCGSAGTAKGRKSCFKVGNKDYVATYAISAAADPIQSGNTTSPNIGVSSSYLDISATTTLGNGDVITRTKRVEPPSFGYGADTAVLRVRALGNDADRQPLYLLNASGTVVPATPFVNGLAVMRVQADSCTGLNAPCHLGLSENPSSYWTNGGYTLSPADITGDAGSLYLGGGTLTDVGVLEAKTASITLRVLAQQPGGLPTSGAHPNSICMWGTYNDGAGIHSAPYCNSGDGTTITVSDYLGPSNTDRYPVFAGQQFDWTVDNPDGSCPASATIAGQAPGTPTLVGAAGNSWAAADVCSGWTWGAPTKWGPTGDSLADWGTVRTTASSPGASYDIVWTENNANSSPVGRPAAGGTQPKAYSQLVIADGPAAYWRLAELSGTTAGDSSGNARNGTYTGAPTLGAGGALVGTNNTAVGFNGSTQYMSATNNASYSVTANGGTIEAWANPTAWPAAGLAYIASKGASANYEWTIAVDNTGAAYFQTTSLAGTGLGTFGFGTVPVGQWSQLTVTVAGNVVKTYKNGTLVTDNTMSAGAAAGTAPLNVGRRGDGFGYFNGIVDEVSMYAGVLSAGKIANHYQVGLGQVPANITTNYGTAATVGVWQKPRAAALEGPAAGCATDGNSATSCSSNVTPTGSLPETGNCVAITPFCLSTATVGPDLSSPTSPYTYNVPNSYNPVPFVIDDAEANAVAWRIPPGGGPANGTLSWNGFAVAAGTGSCGSGTETGWVDGSKAAPAAYNTAATQLYYTKGGGFTTLDNFTFEMKDSAGVCRSRSIGLYSTNVPYTLVTPNASGPQGGSGISVPVTVYGANGAAMAGTSIGITASNPGITAVASSVSSSSAGVATFNVSVAPATPAGTYSYTATASNGKTSTGSFAVTGVPGDITLSLASGSGAQASVVGYTVTVHDKAGTPYVGLYTTIGVTQGGSPAKLVYPLPSSCVTGGGGTCAGSVYIDLTAPAGSYSATATSGSLSSSAQALTVTQTAAKVTVGGATTNKATSKGYAQGVLDGGPRGYWRLGETSGTTAVDSSHGSIPGSYTASPALGGPGALVDDSNTAASFNGTNQYVSIPDNDAYSITQAGGSVEAWVKPTALPASGAFATVVSKGTTGQYEWRVAVAHDSSLWFQAWTLSGTSIANFQIGGAPLNQWSYVAVTAKGNKLVGYLNGIKTQTATMTGTPAAGSAAVNIARTADNSNYFTGSIDEVALYPSTLSVTQTAKRYAAGAGGRAGLVTVAQGATTPVTVAVYDGAGSAITGASVTFTTSSGAYSMAPSPATTNGSGVATSTMTGLLTTSAGAVSSSERLHVVVGGLDVPVGVTIAQTASSMTMVSSTVAVAAGGSGKLQVTVLDGVGNPVSGKNITFAGTETDGTAGIGIRFTKQAVTNTAGIATANVRPTLQAHPGTKTIVATTGSLSQSFTVDVTNALSTITPVNALASVSPGGSTTLRYIVQDDSEQPIDGATVSFSCSSCGLSFIGPVTSDSEGIVDINVTDTGAANKAGSYNVTATVNGSDLDTRVRVAPRATTMTLTSTAPIPLTRGKTTRITIKTFDTNGDALAGVVVKLSSGVSGVTVRSGISGPDGVAHLNVSASNGATLGAISGAVTASSGDATLPINVVVG